MHLTFKVWRLKRQRRQNVVTSVSLCANVSLGLNSKGK